MKFRVRFHGFILLLEKYGFVFLLLSLFCSFLLAVRDTYLSGPNNQNLVWASIWLTLDIPSRDASGWAKLMNILGSLTITWAGLRIYMAAVGVKYDTFVARYLMRNHVVIFAGDSSALTRSHLSHKSVHLVNDSSNCEMAVELAHFLAAEHRVLLCLPGIDEVTRSRLWDSGVSIIEVDASTPDALICSGSKRARILFAMRDHYEENILLVRNAVSVSGPDSGLICHLMIEPLEEKRVFNIEDYFENNLASRIRLFNQSEIIARCLLVNFPPDADVALMSQVRVHLVLVGFGDLGEAILLLLARLGHYRSELTPKVTIVAPNAVSDIQSLTGKFPLLNEYLELAGFDVDLNRLSCSQVNHWFSDFVPPTMIYICSKSELLNLKVAKLTIPVIAKSCSHYTTVPSVVILDPPGGSVLRQFGKEPANKSRVYLCTVALASSDGDHSVLARSLFSDLDDSRAKRLHQSYCESDNQRCALDPSKKRAPANLSWDLLPESFRNANRWSADHVDVKMRAVGRIFSSNFGDSNDELTTEELEVLSRMEHARWCAERQLDGWKYGDVRDDALKVHNLLVPFNQLSEDDKNRDRENVLAIIKIVRDAEGALVRKV